MKSYPIIEVEWFDAASNDDWMDDSEPITTIAHCMNVGMLIHMDDLQVIMVAGVSDGISRTGEFAIPRGCIRKIRTIGRSRTPKPPKCTVTEPSKKAT